MCHMATQNSNRWTTQEGWRYTPCGKWITSRIYIGYVDICPNPTSSGTASTPRTLSSRMVMPLESDQYARRAYMGRTDRLQQTDTVYIDHFLQYQDSVFSSMHLRAVKHLNEDTSIVIL